MSYVPFIIGSTVEAFSVFLFMLTVFRFRIDRRAIVTTLIVAFLFSQVSYFTRLNPEIGGASTYIQIALYVIVTCLVFRVSFFYSAVMNFAGFIGLLVVQGLTIIVVGSVNGVSMDIVTSDAWVGMAVQLLGAFILLITARLVTRLNWGFDFIPSSPRTRVQLRGTNAILLALILFAISAFAVILFLFRNEYDNYVVYSSAVFIVTLPVFIHYALRKDNEDAT